MADDNDAYSNQLATDARVKQMAMQAQGTGMGWLPTPALSEEYMKQLGELSKQQIKEAQEGKASTGWGVAGGILNALAGNLNLAYMNKYRNDVANHATNGPLLNAVQGSNANANADSSDGAASSGDSSSGGFDYNTYRQKVRQIESSGDDQNQTGSNKGRYQFNANDARAYGEDPSRLFDPDVQERMLWKETQKNIGQLNKYGLDVNHQNLYLAHQQGTGAFALLRANPNAPAWQVLAENGISNPIHSIGGNVYGNLRMVDPRSITVGQFLGNVNSYSGWRTQVSSAQPATATVGGPNGVQLSGPESQLVNSLRRHRGYPVYLSAQCRRAVAMVVLTRQEHLRRCPLIPRHQAHRRPCSVRCHSLIRRDYPRYLGNCHLTHRCSNYSASHEIR
jgi:hypothetical protein